jgi:hypothetical protein
MSNPIMEEASEVYLRRREYVRLHIAYLIVHIVFAVLLWPNRGFMDYFRTDTVPVAFQGMVIIHLLAAATISLYAGLDRLAESQIIKHSEWLERTGVPVRLLATGKLVAAMLHGLLLVGLGAPSVVIAAGPAGIPFGAVAASEVIVLLTAVTCRLAGMIISHVGETRYFTRTTGGWIFLALLFVATVRTVPALNPIVSVIRQHSETSPLMNADSSVTWRAHPLVGPGIALSLLAVVLASLYVISLYQHRRRHLREARRAN